jgi:hypothetical protein
MGVVRIGQVMSLESDVRCFTNFRMAVVEMERPQKAEVVVTQLREYMLMVGGMPRPARAQLAQPLMLVDHPCNRKRVPVSVKLVPHSDKNAPALTARRRKFVEHLKAATYLREVCLQIIAVLYLLSTPSCNVRCFRVLRQSWWVLCFS